MTNLNDWLELNSVDQSYTAGFTSSLESVTLTTLAPTCIWLPFIRHLVLTRWGTQ